MKDRKIASRGANHGEGIDAYRFWLNIADCIERERLAT